MKAKLICGWIIALFVFCQPVFAVNCNVLDESLYYGELRTSGNRTCIVDYDDITILPLD